MGTDLKNWWIENIFSGEAPQGYESWHEWAMSSEKKGAYIRKAEPEDWNRPTTKQWDGELPEVGTAAEVCTADNWTECVLKYRSENGVLVEIGGLESWLEFRNHDIRFRPIKSAAEREKEETINEAHEVLRDLPVTASSLDALYEAGMLRKPYESEIQRVELASIVAGVAMADEIMPVHLRVEEAILSKYELRKREG